MRSLTVFSPARLRPMSERSPSVAGMRRMTFLDETTRGGRLDGWELEITEERLSARELIRRRVFQKVADHKARLTEMFQGLAGPEGIEVTFLKLVPRVGG